MIKLMGIKNNMFHWLVSVKGSSSVDKLGWETFDKFDEAKKYYNSLKSIKVSTK